MESRVLKKSLSGQLSELKNMENVEVRLKDREDKLRWSYKLEFCKERREWGKDMWMIEYEGQGRGNI